MKGYRRFILVFSIVLVLYVVTELNKPQPVDWTVSISQSHKKPFGGYVLWSQLHSLFPSATVRSYRTPLYEQVNNFSDSNTAYLLLGPSFNPSKADVDELKGYVRKGNYAFLAYGQYPSSFLDSLKLGTNTWFVINQTDSTSINFVNPKLKAARDYTFLKSTIDEYFSKLDTARCVVLGTNDRSDANFIKLPFGKGAFFIHTNPLCFSNYFLLHHDNASYAAKALSYIPQGVTTVYWDEYYKLGRKGAATPLRFLLNNEYLRWALRIALAGMILYVLFQLKRKQRIIPVLEPLKNSTVEFIRTVAGVYYHSKDNKSIADKKISYWLEFIRNRFNLSTQILNDDFAEQLARKSGISKNEIAQLVALVGEVSYRDINDNLLLIINNKIDNFYKQV